MNEIVHGRGGTVLLFIRIRFLTSISEEREESRMLKNESILLVRTCTLC